MIHLFVYYGANNGEQPNTIANYYGIDWTVSAQGHLRTVADSTVALNLLLTYQAVQVETPDNQTEQDELDALIVELNKQKRIKYLQDCILGYQNYLISLPEDTDPNFIQELNDCMLAAQTELAALLGE
ncbi:MAG: hypothetical protein HWQ38_37855 [Nostoc sp. NMS7]|uniref:hypothetical protein n=1 Tax=Nostoc sp. NMS7 TaxID=2815391 RepID=UPI0025FBC9AC|nr:hypothetical protein [Nostoc sp. NMS7]MBN3951923.1 hypothetical protein [Nostoc sp. NMS7]